MPKTKTLLSFIFMSRASRKKKVNKIPLPIDRVLHPFKEFAGKEASGGIVLILCLVAALAWANSPWASSYNNFWHTELNVSFGSFTLSKSLLHWINDGLMSLFFFVIGLEIKREILVGELATARRAAFPIAAALGGMLVPALIYFSINAGKPTVSGWGVSMATDIAFALGILALVGNKVSLALKVFLTALAIVDDIGAVIIIAFFYTSDLSLASLGVGAVFLILLLLANRLQIKNPIPYALLGFGLWFTFLNSGVHATLAGIIVAMTIPARTRLNAKEFIDRTKSALASFQEAGSEDKNILTNKAQQSAVHEQIVVCEQVESPLQRLEHLMLPWIAFVIMPLFAISNAGVSLRINNLSANSVFVSLGIVFGLVIGKPLGITLFSWLSVRLGIASKPEDMSWRQIFGIGCLGGVGFTMSIFVANLAFSSVEMLTVAKIGILIASLIAGVAGWLALTFPAPKIIKKPELEQSLQN